MGTSLVTKQTAREMRWIAGWTSLVRDLVIDPTQIHRIKADLARPQVQESLRVIRERERFYNEKVHEVF